MASSEAAGSTKPVIAAAAALAGWPSELVADAKLHVMKGGATGRTFKLCAGGKAPSVVVRSIRTPEDAGLVEASQALAAAGLTPKVLASSPSLLVSEFVKGAPPTPSDLVAGGKRLAVVAQLVGKLHGVY